MNASDNDVPSAYPVSISLQTPVRFRRTELLLRIAIWVGLSLVHQSGGGLVLLLYLWLPIIAAVLIAEHGPAGYLRRDAPWLIVALEWIGGFFAYMMLVTDAFPLGPEDRALRLRVVVGGEPSPGRALTRLVTSLPHVLLLVFFGVASTLVSLVAALLILCVGYYPDVLHRFQRDVVARIMRLFAYHVSVVDLFPPLSSSHPEGPPLDDAVIGARSV